MIRKDIIRYSPVTVLTITWVITLFLYFLNPFNLPTIRSYTWFVLLTGISMIYLGFFTARLLNFKIEFVVKSEVKDEFPFSIEKIRKLVLKMARQDYEPGQYFKYVNYNTILLGIILERAIGINPAEYLQDKLARFAVPRYIRIVEDFPRTETFRIKKGELKSTGVTPDTFDAEA